MLSPGSVPPHIRVFTSRDMIKPLLLSALIFAATSLGIPAANTSSNATQSSPASLSVSAPPEWETVTPASDDPNAPVYEPVYEPEADPDPPEAIRGQLGGTVIGPQNVVMDMQNPDLLAPPSTDAGSM